MSNKKDLIVDLCNKIIKDNKYDYYNGSGVCGGIHCVRDNCPFNIYTSGCLLSSEEERLEIAKQYLKDNGVDKMDFKIILSNIEKEFEKAKDLQELDYHYEGIVDHIYCLYHAKVDKLQLQRKKYSFIDVSAIENQGKEIESLVSGYKYIINKDEILFITKDGRHIKYGKDQHVFTFNEIQGEWYINN